MNIRIIGEINAGMLPRRRVCFEPMTREEVQELVPEPELMSWSSATLYLRNIIQRELESKVSIVIGRTEPLFLKPGTSWLLARVNPVKDTIDWWLIKVADDTSADS
jgi:hypothetical protein